MEEVIKAMSSTSNNDGDSTSKIIRVLILSDDGDSVKYRKIEETPNKNVIESSPQINYDNIVLQSSGNLILPIGNEAEKKNSFKIISLSTNTSKISSCPTRKKNGTINVIQTKPLTSTTNVQLTKHRPSIITNKTKPVNLLNGSHTKIQNRSSETCSKIVVSSRKLSKPQPSTIVNNVTRTIPSVSDSRGKEQTVNNLQEQLPIIISEVSEKPSGSSTNISNNNNNCQTVMMRVNSLGELELDPMFYSINELEVEENPVHKREELVVADADDPSSFSPDMDPFEGGKANVNQSWFTSRDDKVMFQSRGHAWKQGMWSKEETEILQKNIMDYCIERNLCDPGSVIFKMSKEERSGFYRIIAKGLNRPLFSIYRRVVRLYDYRNHIGKYTAEEVNKLRELRMKHGNDWQVIAALLGRSAASVKDRCRLMNENCNRGTWTVEEEDRLAVAVYDLASAFPGEQVTSGISWSEVSSRVKTRSEKQCRTKWLNYLNWKRTSGIDWSKNDDIQLICRLSVCGVEDESQVDWSVLARDWPACRSPHWLRGKWWNLKKRLPPSSENISLGEMCQHLYNSLPLNLLRSTLVDLPAEFSLQMIEPVEEKFLSGQTEGHLPSSNVRPKIPASNFASVINIDKKEVTSKPTTILPTTLLVSNGEVSSSQSLVTPNNVFTSSSLPLSSSTMISQIPTSLSSHLTASLTSCQKSEAIIVENLEDTIIQLSEVTSHGVDQNALLAQDPLQCVVKKENILCDDDDDTNAQSGLATSLDPSSPVGSSQVILNDPILSVSGEPLGREDGLHQDHDDACTRIVIV